jgi:hypothetical protein
MSKIINIFNKVFRPKYVVNLNSKEIHELENVQERCKVSSMTHTRYIGKSKLSFYLKNGFNGCRWCFQSKDNG